MRFLIFVQMKTSTPKLPSNFAVYVLFFFLIIAIYGQVFHFGLALDDFLINKNIPGRHEGLRGLFQIFAERYSQIDYRPVVILSFSIEKWIMGNVNPYYSHFVNLILYYLIIVFAYKTILNYLQETELKAVLLISILLFLVHPVHVEVVASLKNRDNLLSLLFTILSMNFLLGYMLKKRKISSLIFGLVFFILAFLSKLDAIGIIFLIPAIFLINKKVSVKYSFFYFILLVFIFILFRNILVDSFVPIDTSVINKGTTFTENPLSRHFTFPNRIAAAALTFWYYIKLLIIPFGYRYYYGFDTIKLYTAFQWQSLSALASCLVLLFLLIKYFIKEKLLLICMSGFVFFIVYALNFYTPVAGIIADRYIFISSLFFCGFVSYFLFILLKNEKYYFITSGIIILLLGFLSFYRTSAWKDKLTLIERDAPSLKNSYEAMRIATSTYIESADKEIDKSLKENLLNKAIHCAESGNIVYPKNVLLNKLLATAYFKLNKFPDARKLFQVAIKNDSSDYESYNFLGDIFYMEKNSDSAFYYYQKALFFNKKDATLISNMSTILYEKGDKKACVDFNEKLLSQNDSLYAAWENLGYYYLQEKDTSKSVIYFESGFKHGLQNTEIAHILSNYLTRNNQREKAKLFKNYE